VADLSVSLSQSRASLHSRFELSALLWRQLIQQLGGHGQLTSRPNGHGCFPKARLDVQGLDLHFGGNWGVLRLMRRHDQSKQASQGKVWLHDVPPVVQRSGCDGSPEGVKGSPP
jgi:hypothetical protein